MQSRIGRIVWPFFAGVLLVGCGFVVAGARESRIAFPEGYRSWTHVKSMVLEKGHPLYESFGGIHHVYANGKAVAGLRKGEGKYSEGSMFVFDLLEADQKDNALVEGGRKVTAVMVKNTKLFATTGGWGFEAFKPGSMSRVVTDPEKQCFACHRAQIKKGYVFSDYRK